MFRIRSNLKAYQYSGYIRLNVWNFTMQMTWLSRSLTGQSNVIKTSIVFR